MRFFYLYKIMNLFDGKVYIGQSTNPIVRWRRHKSDAKLNNKNNYLYNAIRKYGIQNFSFEIIVQSKTLEDIDAAEILCIEQYKSSNNNYGYNIALGGNGKRIVSEQTKLKISQSRIGKKATEETKNKMSKSMIGKNKGSKNGMFGILSENTACAKLDVTQANKIRKEYAIGNTSSLKLAKKYDVSKKTILNIIHYKTYI